MPKSNKENIKWFASVVVMNPHFKVQHGIYDVVHSDGMELMIDVVEALRNRQNSFRKYWPHPDDQYWITPLCIKENEVLTEAGCMQRNFDDYRFTYVFYAQDLCKWEAQTEETRSEEDRRYLYDGPSDIPIEEFFASRATEKNDDTAAE